MYVCIYVCMQYVGDGGGQGKARTVAIAAAGCNICSLQKPNMTITPDNQQPVCVVTAHVSLTSI